MIRLGLCSVTFRDREVHEVIEIARAEGLKGIEWGGDVHVPAGASPLLVRKIREDTHRAGLAIPSYGSYFNALEEPPGDFGRVLETARLLGAGTIRIWAGWVSPGRLSREQLGRLAATARQVAEMGASHGIKVAFEYHDNTPTHGAEAALRLLKAAGHPNLYSYFQPLHPNDLNQTLADFARIRPRLAHVHVQNNDGEDNCDLAEYAPMWRELVRGLRAMDFDRFALFEFNQGNTVEQLRRDAALIRGFLAES